MGVFKLGKMTFGSLFKKPETVLYPIEKKPQPLGLKGHIEVEAAQCILCGMCDKSCPTDCITVDKATRTWSIFPFQCIQCGYCVQVCPKNCLEMDPNYWTATTGKDRHVVEIPEKGKEKAAEKKPVEKVVDAVEKAVEKAAEQPGAGFSAEPESAPVRALDSDLDATIALMDPEKAEIVRAALSKRSAGE